MDDPADLTELRRRLAQAEADAQRLRQTEESYRSLVSAVEEGFCVIQLLDDADGRAVDYRFLQVNAAFEGQTGLRDVVGRAGRDVTPGDEPYWLEIYDEVARTGVPHRFENFHQGTGRHYRVQALRFGAPELRQVSTVFRDVTASRLSEERFRALTTASAYSIYRMSPDWRLMYQLDSDTLAGAPSPIEDWVEKYIPPEDLPAVRWAIEKAIRTRSLFELEHRVWAADGSIAWVLSRAVPVLGPDGEISEWFGVGSDVTERRRATEELRDAEKRYRAELEEQVRLRTAELAAQSKLLQSFMDTSQDMIQVFKAVRDDAGDIVDFRWVLNNRISETRYGEVRDESLLERNPGVLVDGIFDTFKRVAETGVPHVAERHYVHEQFDGWFQQSVVRLDDGVSTTTREISDWKEAQDEVLRLQEAVAAARLRESEDRFEQFAEASSDAIWIRDAHTLRMEFVSPAFEEIYGVARDAVLDDPDLSRWSARLLAEDRPRAIAALEQVREGAPTVHEFRICRAPDGATRWIRNHDFPLRDAEGRVVRIGGIATDITEARHAAQYQATLLAEVQHRVRNTLAMVRSITRRTVQRGGDLDEVAAHLDGRITALSRVQTLLTRAAGAGVDLETLVREELLAQAVEEGIATVEGPEVVLSPKGGEILTLALHELATNATKYGAFAAPSGRVRVQWRVEPAAEGPAWLHLSWLEDGVSVISGEPRRQGFGTELIERRVPYELKGRGEMQFRPGGLAVEIAFPLKPGDSVLSTDVPAGPEEDGA